MGADIYLDGPKDVVARVIGYTAEDVARYEAMKINFVTCTDEEWSAWHEAVHADPGMSLVERYQDGFGRLWGDAYRAALEFICGEARGEDAVRILMAHKKRRDDWGEQIDSAIIAIRTGELPGIYWA